MSNPLELSVTALKSLLADYALRAKQAEETAGLLMAKTLDDVGRMHLFQLLQQHIEARAHDRAVHQQAVIQTTCLALATALSQDDESLRDAVVRIHKNLSLAADAAMQVPISADASK